MTLKFDRGSQWALFVSYLTAAHGMLASLRKEDEAWRQRLQSLSLLRPRLCYR